MRTLKCRIVNNNIVTLQERERDELLLMLNGKAVAEFAPRSPEEVEELFEYRIEKLKSDFEFTNW